MPSYQSTTLPENTFDVVLIGMALMLIPDPRSTVKGKFTSEFLSSKLP